MKSEAPTGSQASVRLERTHPFLNENKKIIAQFILTLFFISLGIWFIKHERAELVEVRHVLGTARWLWILAGIGITVFYILLQGQMYVYAFASVRSKVSLLDSTVLFIKRNLISVFLPAGGVSSLVFFSGTIERKGLKKSQINFASTLYAFTGILSVVIVAIPVFVYAVLKGTSGSGEWFGFGSLVLLTIALYLAYRSVLKKGVLYVMLAKIVPSTEVFMNDLQNNNVEKKFFLFTVLTSMVIEFIGIAHLYVSMIALNFEPSLPAAISGYIISVIFLIVSPFLRGLGAVEVSMTYILIRFGFGNVESIAITFLYRFFEFWMPLFAGILGFLAKLNKLLMRVLPAIVMTGLGIVNIISVLTPAIGDRILLLVDFLPMRVIHVSNYLVLAAGLFLLVTAAFMLKGMRTAWWFAIILSIVSFIGHITKAIDYEEASVALLVIFVLIVTRKEYYIRSDPKFRNVGIQTSLLFTLAIITYGIIGFYFLNKKHFNIDFNFLQSIRFTLQNYFLVGSSELIPADSFARNFLYSINITGLLSVSFLVYTLVVSYRSGNNNTDEESMLAKTLVKSFGTSSLDYFKTYYDKMLFFSESRDAFIAYRISGNVAVALEDPVAENVDARRKCIQAFDRHCYDNGLKSLYYRVPEESLETYHSLHKKDMFLGTEGVVDLSAFTMEGGARKSLRNAINKVTERGYRASVHLPPIKDGVLQKIKSVSDEWLYDSGRTEIIFSQGMFIWEELKQQTIITVENSEERIIGFLNIIPCFSKDEATYDLIRKTKDAPNGVMDFLLVELFKYLKSLNYRYVNIGFAPMSGINDPHTFPERSMKFAYEKIRSFSHYKGLREYKEKFEPAWNNKYLVYQHDYDLLKVPAVLAKVIKPS